MSSARRRRTRIETPEVAGLVDTNVVIRLTHVDGSSLPVVPAISIDGLEVRQVSELSA